MNNNDWRILKRITDSRLYDETNYSLDKMIDVARSRILARNREFSKLHEQYIVEFYKEFIDA